MASVCFYFQVHQPYRIKNYQVFDIGEDHNYFNDKSETDRNNEKLIHKVSQKSYLRTNRILYNLLEEHEECKFAFSISGVLLEQAKEYAPKTLKSFQKLLSHPRVEVLSETYHHSLSFLYSKEEFERQVELHKKTMQDLFGKEPEIFRNTELIYNNELAEYIDGMGYKGVLAEGADRILGWRSPNFVYKPENTESALLLKNYRLSDDIAFRFSREDWEGYPLTAEKFAHWVNQFNGNGEVINLFMDYETFGEHQWEDTGIFEFLKSLPREVINNGDNFVTPSEAIDKYPVRGEISAPEFVSWADMERDLSAWLENEMQKEAIEKVYELEEKVLDSEQEDLIEDWRKLQTSDHFYYMCTKWFSDGDVHKYFNPYDSPYESFINFMNVVNDLEHRVKQTS